MKGDLGPTVSAEDRAERFGRTSRVRLATAKAEEVERERPTTRDRSD